MAAVLRAARAGRGGPGRAQGMQRGAAVQQAPDPAPVAAQVLAPLNQPWKFWKEEGNLNMPYNADKDSEELKIYRRLEKSPFVDEMELVTFGIPDGLPPQPAEITRKLDGLVDSYNMMMPLRQKYLYKKLNGQWGKEMSDIEKTLTKCVHRIDERIEDIRAAGGFCPDRPKLFDRVPKPLKK